ncbi:SDR family oxidoreductase [Luteimonas aestuarii]|nr:SDR family oxidoreductase [Luteimonas aestuarii]
MNGIIDNGTIAPALLVLGAGGEAGRGVVRAALDDGRAVVAVSHDAAALQALRGAHPRAPLRTLQASVASDGDAAGLAARLRALRIGFDGVVASLVGDHPCGRLVEQPDSVLRKTLDEDLMPHLFAARHLFPMLSEHAASGYVLIGGPGGDYPWAGYGHCSIAAAALRMMARVLHDEAARHGLHVQLLALDAPLDGTRAAHDAAAFDRATTTGRRALAMLDIGRETLRPSHPDRHRAVPRHPTDHLPARELRDARALLSSLSVLPPTSPGILHDEAF